MRKENVGGHFAAALPASLSLVILPTGIGADGQAYFHEVPANFLDQEVPISVESDTYEPTKPDEKYRLSGSSLYVSVRRRAGRISGPYRTSMGTRCLV